MRPQLCQEVAAKSRFGLCGSVEYCCVSMLAGQRQLLILEQVRLRGAVRVAELTELLDVSDMTIRRDLDEQEAIAEAAAALVEPGQAVGLTAGTTTWRLAHHLRGIPDLTVVTNSIQAANVLHRDRRPDLTVILTGGVRTPSDALVGPVAVTTLRSLHVDVLFMGVHGMSEDVGFTTPNLLEAETDQAFVMSAERVVVTADYTKWGVRGLSRIARLDEVHALVSDGGLPADARTILQEHVRELLVVAKGKRRRQRGGV